MEGAYLLTGRSTGTAPVLERFTCGAGPAGWRYVATRVPAGGGADLGTLDVVLDDAGAVVRAEVRLGGWTLRGGAVGPDLLWRRGEVERSARADGFTGSSPVWAVAATRRAHAAGTGPRRLRLVLLGDEALATREVSQAWSPRGGADRDGLRVTSYDVADLETGQQAAVHLAGDLVLEAPGVELVQLDAR